MNNSQLKYSVQSLGKEFGSNEDAHYEDLLSGIFIVADGMGEDKHGSLASQMAVEHISRTIDSTSVETESTWLFEKKETLSLEENFLRMALLHANTKIISRAEHEEKIGLMGCSVIAAFVVEDKIVIGGIGNCRGYLFRKGGLTQLTQDASLAQYKRQFPLQPTQNIPLNFMGKSRELEIDQSSVKTLREGDLYLLTSSGISNSLSHEQILKEIKKNINNINKLSESLVKMAFQKNKSQDETVLILKFVTL